MHSGLLLPIVAVEQKWGKKEFLEETCRKAGIHTELLGAAQREAVQVRDPGVQGGDAGWKVIELKYDKHRCANIKKWARSLAWLVAPD